MPDDLLDELIVLELANGSFHAGLREPVIARHLLAAQCLKLKLLITSEGT